MSRRSHAAAAPGSRGGPATGGPPAATAPAPAAGDEMLRALMGTGMTLARATSEREAVGSVIGIVGRLTGAVAGVAWEVGDDGTLQHLATWIDAAATPEPDIFIHVVAARGAASARPRELVGEAATPVRLALAGTAEAWATPALDAGLGWAILVPMRGSGPPSRSRRWSVRARDPGRTRRSTWRSRASPSRWDLPGARGGRAGSRRRTRCVESNEELARRARSRDGAGRGRRAGERGEERVPRRDEPRDPHADERRPGHATRCCSRRSSPPSSGGLAEDVQASGESLLEIIDQILDLSKIEAGRLELDETDFDLHAVITAASAIVRPVAIRKNLYLGVRLLPNLPIAVRGDPLRLRQVLINLLGNAVKFTDSGQVLLRVAPLGDGRRPAGDPVRGGRHGRRASRRTRSARLFQPFTQADTLDGPPVRWDRARASPSAASSSS